MALPPISISSRSPRIHSDRAAIVTTTIRQLAALPDDLRAQIENLLRDEFAKVEQQAVADRGDPQPGVRSLKTHQNQR
jgi:hypothetical protein